MSARFEGSRHWGDLFALLFFGVFGWTMKQFKWPRPPLILGFVLGDVIERYMFISIERYGAAWLGRPVVIVLLAFAAVGLVRPLVQDVAIHGGLRTMLTDFSRPRLRPSDLFYVFIIAVLGGMLMVAADWDFGAKIAPMIVGSIALACAVASLVNQVFRPGATRAVGIRDEAKAEIQQKIHMDIESDTAHVPVRLIVLRAAIFFGWLLAFMASMATIGMIPTIPLFVIAYMRLENREPWKLVLPQALGLTLFVYLLFERLLSIPWPQTILGSLVPAFKVIPSVQ